MAITHATLTLVAYGVVSGLAYVGLTLLGAIPRGATSGPLWVAILLLILGMGLGGGTLLSYAARRRSRIAIPVRSLGVAASLTTLLGGLVILFAIASEPGPLSRFAIPVYTLEVALSLCLLWLQTFPVTSPTARRIVDGTLLVPCLLAPVATAILLNGLAEQPWLTILSLAWLPVLLAQRHLRHIPLDLRVPGPARDAAAERRAAA